MRADAAPIEMEEVTDPEELAKARAQRQLFDRNSAWFQTHAKDIYPEHRGKCVVIAAEQAFAADTPEEAWALVEAAGIRDDGSFILYVPSKVMPRIYAC